MTGATATADLAGYSETLPADPVTKALALATGLGLAVLPCLTDKSPAPGWGVTRATTDPELIVAAFIDTGAPLVGVACGASGLIVVDIDRHPGAPDGYASLTEAAVELPTTWRHPSISGTGEHVVYAAPADARGWRPFAGVDLKAGAGYVIWSGDVPTSRDVFAPAPTWTAKASQPPQEPTWTATAADWCADNHGAPEGRLSELLDALPAHGAPDWSNDNLVAIALPLVSAAEWDRGGAAARARFIDCYAAGDWSGAKWRTIAERAFDRAIATAGRPTRATMPALEFTLAPDGLSFVLFDPIAEAEAITAEAAKVTRRPLADLMAREFAPLDWVVPGIMPEGVTLLVAPPKAGKSWLALDIALAAATGGKALGSIPVGRARPVLYCDMESGERRLQSRVQAQGWQEFGRFDYHLDRATALTEAAAFVAEHAAERPLVVIDTLAAVQADRPKERTQYQHDYETLAQFQRFTRSTPGAAVLIVHHTRKAISGDPMDSVSGTNGLSGAVDTPMVLVRPDRHSPEGELNVMARDFEGGEFALRFEGCRWHVDGGGLSDSREAFSQREEERRRGRLGPIKQGLLLMLESDPREWTAAELVDRYGGEASEGALRKAIPELADAGLVVRVGRGIYRAA